MAASQSSPAAFTIAKAPFDESNVTDVVFRTSDHVDFYVVKAVLALASPFFRDMFSLTQPASNTQDPIVVSEKSDALDSLFRLCYPVDDPVFKDLDALEPVLEVAIKYQMAEATKLLTAQLEKMSSYNTYLRVYAISCRLDLEEHARSAASEYKSYFGHVGNSGAKEFGSTTEGKCYHPQMSVGSYFRLIRYLRDEKSIPRNRHGLQPYLKRDAPQDPTFCRPSPVHLLPSHSEHTAEPSSPLPSVVHMGDTDTDLLLCTSDGVEVAVHSIVLRLASAEKLIQLPRNIQAATGLPVIQLTFRYQVLRSLLDLCYPFQSPPLDLETEAAQLYIMREVLQIANQYDISKIVPLVKDRVVRYFMKDHPLLVYFLSVEQSWQDITLEAARRTVHLDIEDTYVPWMELVPAVSYYNLLEYRRTYQSSVIEVLRKYPYAPHIAKWEDVKRYLASPSQKMLSCEDHPLLFLIYAAISKGLETLRRPLPHKLALTQSLITSSTEKVLSELSQKLSSITLPVSDVERLGTMKGKGKGKEKKPLSQIVLLQLVNDSDSESESEDELTTL